MASAPDLLAPAAILDYILQSANRIELRVNIEYSACLYTETEMQTVTDVELQPCTAVSRGADTVLCRQG